MNTFAVVVVVLVASLRPITIIVRVSADGVNDVLTTVQDGIDYFDPWHDTIGHLLNFNYYNSELGNDRPIKIEFRNESAILEYWIRGLPLKLITHGWLAGDNKDEGVFAIKTAYVETRGYNVITLDWSLISECIVYPAPVIETKCVGLALANFLDRLICVTGLRPVDIHLIGHSLGAHVVGTAGKYLVSGKIGRVSGLDPASPGYETIPVIQSNHLNRQDATFVDVIHTAAGTLGYQSSIGHVNFYPNSGKDPQPGCNYPINSLFCSHSRSYELYTDSVYYRKSLFGLECSSWSAFKKHKCTNNTVVPMGHDAKPSSRGNFYEWTNSRHPFKTYLWKDPNAEHSKHKI